MSELPPPAERQRVLSELAALITTYGHAQFVAAPIVEPTMACFPEGFGDDASSLGRTARRLLQYAGMGGLRVEIGFLDRSQEMSFELRAPWAVPGTLVWLDELDDHHCQFKVDSGREMDHGAFTGALVREVARAFRAHRKLGGAYRGTAIEATDDDETIIDLTAVYLGLGVVASYGKRRIVSQLPGPIGISEKQRAPRYEHCAALPAETLAFAVAVHAVARGLDGAQRERLAVALEREHTGSFRDACKSLAAPGELDGLRLPPRAEWPPVGQVGEPLPDEPMTALAVSRPALPVFRVAQSGTTSTLLPWGALGFLGSMVALVFTHTYFSAVLFPVAILVGVFRGRARSWDTCSSCQGILRVSATDCPTCKGVIGGRIKHRDDRLDAEQKLLDSGWKSDDASDDV